MKLLRLGDLIINLDKVRYINLEDHNIFWEDGEFITLSQDNWSALIELLKNL